MNTKNNSTSNSLEKDIDNFIRFKREIIYLYISLQGQAKANSVLT